MFRQAHPFGKAKLTLKQFADAGHVVVISPGTGHAKVNETIERKGIQRRIRLVLVHFVAIGHILSATDATATVPKRYTRMRDAVRVEIRWPSGCTGGGRHQHLLGWEGAQGAGQPMAARRDSRPVRAQREDVDVPLWATEWLIFGKR